ncbi:hypothetical protein [Saccharopolyspora spinosa]|uniref:hypothetical protein n=1 Tax=Saccharopolyspora spinosa TaxID=60894 RepID=UPI000237B106|nr:hypothetical protein [Saccharopolyspora spinosa]
MFADPDTVRRVIDHIRHESAAQWVEFTGGDPLMPYDNHLEVALRPIVYAQRCY